MTEAKHSEDKSRKGGLPANAAIAIVCLAAVVGMIGASYASVPLYRIFCQVTGYGGTTARADNSQGIPVVDRNITVRFDANIAPSLSGMKFRPMQRDVTVKLGEVRKIEYYAENNTDHAVHATATFNLTPQQAGAYFNKLECFCFTETVIQPGEKVKMPVVFFVDPELIDEAETRDIHTVTLSYTMFPSTSDGTPIRTSRSIAKKDRATDG